MIDVLLDAIVDTIKIFPFLLIAYILIEIFSYYFSERLNNAVLSKWAPLFGSFLGIVPQCGFSVLSAELYTRRFITIGTLFAVFLATSDEAFVILITSEEGLKALLPVIFIKLISAIIIGTIIDLIFIKRNKELLAKAEAELDEEDSKLNNMEELPTCGCSACVSPNKWQMFLISPFLHALKILAFIFVINLIFSTMMYLIGEENVVNFLQSSSVFAPVFSALVGLIPNCASSVIITELYILGGINFASLVAGLCANVGIGSMILFKNLKIKEAILIILSLFLISVIIGYLLMFFKIGF